MPGVESLIEELKKKGVIPPDTELITKLTNDNIGKVVMFEATVKEVGIKLSPPVIITDEVEGEIVDSGFETRLLDVDVSFKNGYLFARFSNHMKRSVVADYFNATIAIFNILGIPFDFISESEILIMLAGLEREDIVAVSSLEAQRKGLGIEPIRIPALEFAPIPLTMLVFWEKIKKSEFFKTGEFYEFLGYSRYYYLHDNFFLSFIHAWLFIELMINLLWEKLMNERFSENPPTTTGRDWTIQIKIDELYLLGQIDDNLRRDLHTLRRKRNAVFHVDPREEKREVSGNDALNAVKAGLMLFYKLILGLEDGKIIDFSDLTKQMYQAIHGPPPP